MTPSILDLHDPPRTPLRAWRPSRTEALLILAAIAVPPAILVLLATMLTFHGSNDTRENAAQADLSSMRTALDAFQVDNARYPTTAEGLTPLVTRPPALPTWRGPYLEEIRIDPWRTPYRYTLTPGTRPDLRSAGPDQLFDTPDDLTY
jgi:general secretion pathway protein G